MTAELKILSRRVGSEVVELQKIGGLALRRWRKSLQDEDCLGSVAFDLQSFYQGIERVFSIVAAGIDGIMPTGERWHKDLPSQMTREVPGSRPAVISQRTGESLERFRRFRHLARNMYPFQPDRESIRSLAEGLPETCDQVSSGIAAFAEFLSKACAGAESE